MTHQQHAFSEPMAIAAGQQFARLRHVLDLTRQIAGSPAAGRDLALDESARVSGAYDAASPIAQRRFDMLVAETAAWAGAGLDALAACDDPRKRPAAAAGRLVDELEFALAGMARLLRI